MKISAILLTVLLMHYNDSTTAQIFEVTDNQGHTQFTDQHNDTLETSVLTTVIKKTPTRYQSTNNSATKTKITHSIQQRKAKIALSAHQKKQRYQSWRKELAEKKQQIDQLKSQLSLAKKIHADDFIANAQGGVRLKKTYRDRVNDIHQKLIMSEKNWLNLRRNQPN